MLVIEKNSLTEEIEKYVKEFGKDRAALLEILHQIQRKHRCISDFAQQEVARLLDIHPVEVYSVITFYSFLNARPMAMGKVRA